MKRKQNIFVFSVPLTIEAAGWVCLSLPLIDSLRLRSNREISFVPKHTLLEGPYETESEDPGISAAPTNKELLRIETIEDFRKKCAEPMCQSR